MSTIEKQGGASADGDFSIDRQQAESFGEYVGNYLSRVRGGDMGMLPALAGLAVLFIIFSMSTDAFLKTGNLTNLLTQGASICVLAMGVVFVLLLGEIDLSAGVTGATVATITAMLMVQHEQSWWLSALAGLIAGAAVGAFMGWVVAKLGVPSFVVTLAFFLGLQGVILKIIGEGGSLRYGDDVLRGMSIKNVPVAWGWIAAVVIITIAAVLSLRSYVLKRNRGLANQPLSVVVVKLIALGAITLGIVYLLSTNRANPNAPIEIRGIPWVLPVVVVLLLVWTFVLGRTSYGRHLYAVGGNAEAARRAGINVTWMKISAFIICSTMAGVAGILSASYTGSVSPSSGGGNVLLYAVGAAVIGGTSLFGGRGRAIDGVVGGLVITTINNGLGLLNQAAYINFLVTGGVLLLAATVDAVSRRRRSASGV